jgi:heme exporter protein D
MDQLTSYFAMGGYGGFIWPAYALTAAILIGLLIASRRTLTARESELAAIRGAEENETADEA